MTPNFRTLDIVPDGFIAACLTGSRDFGIAVDNSDYDWRLFSQVPIERANFPQELLKADVKNTVMTPESMSLDVIGNVYNLAAFFSGDIIVASDKLDKFQQLIAMREDLVTINLPAVKQSICLNIQKAMGYVDRTTLSSGYGKAVGRVMYYSDMLQNYAAGETFDRCLHPENSSTIVAVRGKTYDRETATELLIPIMHRNDDPAVLGHYDKPINDEKYQQFLNIIHTLSQLGGH